MRKLLTSLLVLSALIGSLLASSPAGAAVPDKPFTQTQCEGYSDSVARLYTAGLGREPEQGGFDFWINEYTFGNWSFPRMAQFFVESPEFAASYGELNQDEFIRQLYRNVLDREGESGGVTFWNEQMTAGMSRATVLMRFAESPENITNSGTVQPILGPFNEGRQGSWRCGPSVAEALFQSSDFPNTWFFTEGTTPSEPLTGCEAAFNFQSGDTDSTQFSGPAASGPLVGQGIYVYATPFGAEAYLAQTRQAILDCASYQTSGGLNVTISEMNMTSFGDDSVAYRLSYSTPDGSVAFDLQRVTIRDGLVVTGVGHLDLVFTDPALTEQWAALAAERIAALPFNA